MKRRNRGKRHKHNRLLALFLSILLLIPASTAYAKIYGFITEPRFSYKGETSLLGGSRVSVKDLLESFQLEGVAQGVTSSNDAVARVVYDGEWFIESTLEEEGTAKITVHLEDEDPVIIEVDISGVEKVVSDGELEVSISSSDGTYLPEESMVAASVEEDVEELVAALEEEGQPVFPKGSLPTEQEENTFVAKEEVLLPKENDALVASEQLVGEDVLVEENQLTQVDKLEESDLLVATENQEEEQKELRKAASNHQVVSHTIYQAFDISLQNVNTEAYDGFLVNVTLPEEIVGRDFALYHIHDGISEELDVELVGGEPDETGNQLVEAISFVTENFSSFVFKYTVDFAYEGCTWRMPGGATLWLSTLLTSLHIDIDTVDVKDVFFSNDSLLLFNYDEEEHDWLVRSLTPFHTKEKMTLVLIDGQTLEIAVTDEQEPMSITNLLTNAEFFTNNIHAGGSDDPSVMLVQDGQEFRLSLTFTEDENDDEMQFPDTGVMKFELPNNVHLPDAYQNVEMLFDIVLDRRNTLKDNIVKYHPPEGNNKAYLTIEWSKTDDPKKLKLLAASPRATFTLNFTGTTVTVENTGTVDFRNDITVNVEKDKRFNVDLEKSAKKDETDPSIIHYTVAVKADGHAENVTIADTMGEALSYQHGTSTGVKVEYESGKDYGENNIAELEETDGGFSLKLNELDNGDVAYITYDAKVDYTKLGGKVNIAETSRNEVTAFGVDLDPIADESHSLENELDYLKLDKCVGDDSEVQYDYYPPENEEIGNDTVNHTDWKAMYVPWNVTYNPEQNVNVEGFTLTDQFYAGAKRAVTYDQSKSFVVTAYPQGGTVNPETGVFTPNGTGVVIKENWDSVEVKDYDATGGENGKEQLSTWSWTIPPIGSIEDDPRQEGIPYTYTVTYWTKVDREKTFSGGYIRNMVKENFADLSRERTKWLPGVSESTQIEVNKAHLEDKYVKRTNDEPEHSYSKWKISFKRRDNDLEAAVVEDELPHIIYGDRVLSDQFISDAQGAYAWSIDGLGASEQCVTEVESHHVNFRFYTYYVDENSDENKQGLHATGAGYPEDITITFWTENSIEWIDATTEGKLTPEHLNRVHLVLDGHEANHSAFGTPKKAPDLEKKVTEVGKWTNESGITMPVYRYTLKLTGMTDDAFTENKIIITDTFETPLKYVSYEKARELSISAGPSDGKLLRKTPSEENGYDVVVQEDPIGTLTIMLPKEDFTLCNLVDEEGNVVEGAPLMYGQAYEISYYMTLDHEEIVKQAQEMVDSHQTSQTIQSYSNKASWTINAEGIDSPEAAVDVDYDRIPVVKEEPDYEEDNELVHYTIVANPLKLKLYDGQRLALEDEYTNLAVDFETVKIICEDKEGKKTEATSENHLVEWSYHGNKGTFWIPDETKVTITYDGWPVGIRGEAISFTNTAKLSGYEKLRTVNTTLKADHEGTAASYRIRLFKFANDNMDLPLPNAVFQLFENDENGNMVPMQYQKASDSQDDEADWVEANKLCVQAGIQKSPGVIANVFPTPEKHDKDDYIYFVTGEDGFAEVMLSQSRDSVALKMNHQYYLKEVLEPEGYQKEDVVWRFIIGDNDDWDHYVYSDDSVMQVSNASKERTFTLHKDYDDRTIQKLLTDELKANDEFIITGWEDETKSTIIYNKTITYSYFKNVSIPQSDGSVQNEKVLILKDLPNGYYEVSETYSKAAVTASLLTTLADGTVTTQSGEESEVTTPLTVNKNGEDTYISFKVEDDKNTSVDVTFTNIYTDQEVTSLKIVKNDKWSEKEDFIAIKAELAIYADGEHYKLTEAEGANISGNLVLPVQGKWEVVLDTLPKKNANGADIVWTIEEVSATYSLGGAEITADGVYLHEDFTVNPAHITTFTVNESDNLASVTFTNTFNDLTEVEVKKVWKDSNQGEHEEDSVFFDLYRTTDELPADKDYERFAREKNLVPVIADYELNQANNWEYKDELLEKADNSGAQYKYFVVEKSVAGYDASYAFGIKSGSIIENTPHEAEKEGILKLTKHVEGVSPTKSYQFTLWNSGKYLNENGRLTTEKAFIEFPANGTKIIKNVKLGDYILTEVAEAAEVGGYNLTDVKISVGNSEPTSLDLESSLSTVVRVDKVATIQNPTTSGDGGDGQDGESETIQNAIEVIVTNTYEKQPESPKTSFSFGKLWVIPDERVTTTLEWPENTSVKMVLKRRLKGATEPDESFSYTYTISRGASVANEDGSVNLADIVVTSDENQDAPTLMQQSGDVFHDRYNHYIFVANNLELYDENGNEWEYYAVEDGSQIQTTEGKTFTTKYGYVDGIAARVVDELTEASDRSGHVGCVINRLNIDKEIKIPVQKRIMGRLDLSEQGAEGYPPFTFTLHDDKGNVIKRMVASTDAEGITPEIEEPITIVTDGRGQANFDVTSLVKLNEMRWWPYEKKLHGKYTFYIVESPNSADNTAYNGITNMQGATKVEINADYDWVSGELTFITNVTTPGQETVVGEEATTIDIANLINTYDTGATQVKVTKNWEDDNDRDGYRKSAWFKIVAAYSDETGSHNPPEVWFLKDGQKDENRSYAMPYSFTVGTSNPSTRTLTLPKYYEGHELTYTVEEDMTAQGLSEKYQSTFSDTAATNTHTPETIGILFTKIWEGKNPKDEDTIRVRLKASYAGKEVTIENLSTYPKWNTDDYKAIFDVVTLSNTQNWKKMWEKLPRFAPGEKGKKVKYTVEELPESIPMGYYQSASQQNGGTADPNGTNEQTITNTYVSLDIPVEKIWDDDNNRDGLREESVTFQLTAKDSEGNDITSQLKYNDGTAVNIDTLTQTLSETSDWKCDVWKNLPKYYQGKEIKYTVTEIAPVTLAGYTLGNPATTGKGLGTDTDTNTNKTSSRSITNKHEIYTTQIKLTKIWDDDKNRDGKRPNPVTFLHDYIQLKAVLVDNEEPVVLTVGEEADGNGDYPLTHEGKSYGSVAIEGSNIYSEDGQTVPGNYIITFKNLPRRRDQGKIIEYSIVENEIAEYTANSPITISNPADDTENVTSLIERTAEVSNTYAPKKLNIKATKVWNHTNNTAQTKPETAKLKLEAYSGDEKLDMASAAWNEKEYFIVAEQEKSGNNVLYEWNNLPQYVPNRVNEPITYKIVEVDVPDGYKYDYQVDLGNSILATSINDNETGEITVTNTYEDVKITATKKWDDANNQDGLRKPVTLQLQESVGDTSHFVNVENSSKSIGVLDDFTAEWKDMPAWRNNKPIFYRVVEVYENKIIGGSIVDGSNVTGIVGEQNDVFPEYTTVYDSFPTKENDDENGPKYVVSGNITNSHTPNTKTATFTKRWEHKGASNYLTPDKYKEKIHLWARIQSKSETFREVLATGDNPTEGTTYWEFALDWKNESHLSVKDENGDYVVEITDLPVNCPRDNATETADVLEYFITEDAVDYYSVEYPTGDGHPEGKAGEGETLTNTRDTDTLYIHKTVVSELESDKTVDFAFNVKSTPKITGKYTVDYFGRSTEENILTELEFNDQGLANGQVKLKGNQAITIKGLPVGVDYSVTEVENQDFTSANTSNGVMPLVKEGNASVQFTNKRKLADLEVEKIVHSTVKKDLTDQLFSFKVTVKGMTTEAANKANNVDDNGYYYENDSNVTKAVMDNGDVTFVFSLKNSEKWHLKNLPLGIAYTVEEVFNEQEAMLYATPIAQSGLLSESGETRTFTNMRQYGSLNITKELEGAIPDDENDVFYFDVTLTGDDQAALVLSEDAPIKVNNEILTSDITKTPYYENGVIHDVPVTWTSTGASTSIISGLPAGTTYKVTERDTWTDTRNLLTKSNIQMEMTEQTGTIVTNEIQTGTFTNRRKVGSLDISKTVISPIIKEKTDDSYTIHVLLRTKYEAVPVSGQQSYNMQRIQKAKDANGDIPVDAQTTSTDDTVTFTNGEADIRVHHGETVHILGIPTDVHYTVSETTPTNFKEPVYHSQSGEIIAVGNVTAQISNEHETGGLKVTKTVISAVDKDKDKDFAFEVTLDTTKPIKNGIYGGMTFENNVARFTLKKGEEIEASGLPVGISYTVTETQDENFEPYRVTGNTGDISTSIQTAAFTNVRKTGTLKIIKEVENALPDDLNTDFSFQVTMKNNGESLNYRVEGAEIQVKRGENGTPQTVEPDENGVITVQSSSELPAILTGIPVGTTCSVQEASDRTKGNITFATESQNAEVNIAEAERNPEKTFKNTRAVNNLVLTKTVTSPVVGEDEAWYDMTIALNPIPVKKGPYTLNGQANDTNDNSISEVSFDDGGQAILRIQAGTDHAVTIQGIPTDVECTVTEAEVNQNKFTVKYSANDEDDQDSPAKVTINKNRESTAQIHNIRKTGKLALQKSVDSPIEKDKVERLYLLKIEIKGSNGEILKDTNISETSTVSYGDLQFTNGRAYVWLKNDESPLYIENLPAGFIYEVTELVSRPDGETTGSENDPSYSDNFQTTWTCSYPGENEENDTSNGEGKNFPESENVTNNKIIYDKEASVVFHNQRKTGELTINKDFAQGSLHSIPGDDDQIFKYTVVLTRETEEGVFSTSDEVAWLEKWVDGEKQEFDSGKGESIINENGTITATILCSKNHPATLKGIPVGTDYQVTEVLALSDNFTLFGSDFQTGKITIDNMAEGKPGKSESVIFTNDRKTGNLVVKKVVDSPVKHENDTDSYEIVVTLDKVPHTLTGYMLEKSGEAGTTVDFKVDEDSTTCYVELSIKNGQTATIKNLPTDLAYTITEPKHTNFDAVFTAMDVITVESGDFPETQENISELVEEDEKVQRIIEAKQTHGAQVKNIRKTGELLVSKSVISSVQGDMNHPFVFRLTFDDALEPSKITAEGGDITFDTHDSKIVTFKLDATTKKSIKISGLPLDIGYKVEELKETETPYESDNFIPKLTQGTKDEEVPEGSVLVASGYVEEENTVAFENTRKPLELTINKTLENAILDDDGDIFYFDVLLKGADGARLVLDDKQPLKVNGVRVSVGVPTGGSDGSESDDGQDENNDGSPLYYEEETGILHNVPVTWHVNDEDSIPTGVGGSAKISGLPIGTKYTVKETGWKLGHEGAENNIVQASANNYQTEHILSENNVASFTNKRLTTASLKVKKLVEDSPIETERTGEYEIVVELQNRKSGKPVKDIQATLQSDRTAEEDQFNNLPLSFADGKETIKIRKNETVTISGIPTDVKYIISESGATLFDKSFKIKVDDEYVEPDAPWSGDITTPGTIETEVINTRKLGNLTIGKNVVSDVDQDDEQYYWFKVELDEPAIDNGFYKDLEAVGSQQSSPTYTANDKGLYFLNNVAYVKLKHNETVTICGLPVGLTYKVTEITTEVEFEKIPKDIKGEDTFDAQYAAKFDPSWEKTVDEDDGEPKTGNSPVFTDDSEGETQFDTITEAKSTVLFTNTRKTGALQLTKLVHSPFASEQIEYYPFTMEMKVNDSPISGTFKVEPSVPKVWDNKPDGTELTDEVTFTNGKAVIYVKGNQADIASPENTVTVLGLPIDAVCTVTEALEAEESSIFNVLSTVYKDDIKNESGQSESQTDVTITAGVTSGATITNSRNKQPILLKKISTLPGEPVLSGAKFELSGGSGVSAWTIYLFSRTDGKFLFDPNPVGEVANNETLPNGVSLEAGLFILPVGEYTLTETKAPDGYILLAPVKITVSEDDVTDEIILDDVRWTHTAGHGDKGVTIQDNEGNTYVQLLIPNSPGVALPATGGPGTTAIYVLGLLATSISGFILLLKLKETLVKQ